jgi:hypothetical protein
MVLLSLERSVDVGLTKMYAVQPQCENLVLGTSHDNGSVRILSKLETDGIMPGKIILLQGATFAPELQRFDSGLFPRIRFGELFMDKKLDSAKKYAQVAAEQPYQMARKSTSPLPTPTRLMEPELCNYIPSHADSSRMVICQES